MKCEICNSEIGGTIWYLPIPEPSGAYNTQSCEECALKSGLVCALHNRIKLGYSDSTYACIGCVDDVVRSEGERIAGNFAARISGFPEIQEYVDRWWHMLLSSFRNMDLGDLVFAEQVAQFSRAENIARLIVTKAVRMDIDPKSVIEQVVTEGPQVILPDLPDFEEL